VRLPSPLGAAETGANELGDDLSTGDRVGAQPDGRGVEGFGDVVMIAVESAPRSTESLSEGVQLGERDVTDQV
jgi:hypothetical protein